VNSILLIVRILKVYDVDITMSDNMNILCKIVGLIFFGLSALLIYLEYAISTTISEIATKTATAFGLSESSSLGLAILFHIPVLGLIFLILIFICLFIYLGYIFMMERL